MTLKLCHAYRRIISHRHQIRRHRRLVCLHRRHEPSEECHHHHQRRYAHSSGPTLIQLIRSPMVE